MQIDDPLARVEKALAAPDNQPIPDALYAVMALWAMKAAGAKPTGWEPSDIAALVSDGRAITFQQQQPHRDLAAEKSLIRQIYQSNPDARMVIDLMAESFLIPLQAGTPEPFE